MFRTRSVRVALVIASATVLAATAAGVTYATTALSAPKVVYACTNAGGTLRLLTRGHCPTGYRKVGINRQGPTGATGPRGLQGPAGPGAVAVQSESDTVTTDPHDTPIPGTGLTMTAVCQADPNGSAGLYLLDTDGSAAYDVNGSDELAATGGGHAYLVYNSTSHPNLTPPLGPIEFTQPASQNSNSEFVAQLSAGGTAELTADVTVTRGTKTFLLHIHVYETATHCVSQGWATPTT